MICHENFYTAQEEITGTMIVNSTENMNSNDGTVIMGKDSGTMIEIADTGTMINHSSGTMIDHSGTMIENTGTMIEADFGTMVINDSDESTMRSK